MKENITYSDCLSEVLSALNIKSSKLAREINIDSSLIYKWLRNERVPSHESPYIDLILACISKRLENPVQRKAVSDLLAKYDILSVKSEAADLLNNLRLILQTSQAYSLRLKKTLKRIDHLDLVKAKVESRPLISSAYDKVQIMNGPAEIFYSVINLLIQAANHHTSLDPILLTCNSGLWFHLGAKKLEYHLVQVLHNLLKGGWEILLLIRLDGNTSRTVEIIKNLHLFSAGNLKVYYQKHSSADLCNKELCVVPDIGALYAVPTENDSQSGSAFLFRSRQSIKIWREKFFHDLTAAAPLLRSYPPQTSFEFQRVLADVEKYPGDKYLFKEGLSTVTMPLILYEKYLRRTGIANHELSHRLFLHRQRIESFHGNVKHYQYKDICFIESLEDLIKKSQYSFDENYILKNIKPTGRDIACQLEYLLHLLQTYDNYEIAFIKRSDYPHISNINFMVKNKDFVMIETYDQNSSVKDSPHNEKNFTIGDRDFANAFQEYFCYLWRNIPDSRKDKKKSIRLLKQLITK